MTRPSTSSGTPSSERIPFWRRIGLRMSAWSTSAMAIGCRWAATRPAKPLPTGMPDTLLDLLLDPLRRPRVQHPAVVVEQQDGRRVGVQDLRDPVEQRRQQVAERQVRERGIGEPLKLGEFGAGGETRGAEPWARSRPRNDHRRGLDGT